MAASARPEFPRGSSRCRLPVQLPTPRRSSAGSRAARTLSGSTEPAAIARRGDRNSIAPDVEDRGEHEVHDERPRDRDQRAHSARAGAPARSAGALAGTSLRRRARTPSTPATWVFLWVSRVVPTACGGGAIAGPPSTRRGKKITARRSANPRAAVNAPSPASRGFAFDPQDRRSKVRRFGRVGTPRRTRHASSLIIRRRNATTTVPSGLRRRLPWHTSRRRRRAREGRRCVYLQPPSRLAAPSAFAESGRPSARLHLVKVPGLCQAGRGSWRRSPFLGVRGVPRVDRDARGARSSFTSRRSASSMSLCCRCAGPRGALGAARDVTGGRVTSTRRVLLVGEHPRDRARRQNSDRALARSDRARARRTRADVHNRSRLPRYTSCARVGTSVRSHTPRARVHAATVVSTDNAGLFFPQRRARARRAGGDRPQSPSERSRLAPRRGSSPPDSTPFRPSIDPPSTHAHPASATRFPPVVGRNFAARRAAHARRTPPVVLVERWTALSAPRARPPSDPFAAKSTC